MPPRNNKTPQQGVQKPFGTPDSGVQLQVVAVSTRIRQSGTPTIMEDHSKQGPNVVNKNR